MQIFLTFYIIFIVLNVLLDWQSLMRLTITKSAVKTIKSAIKLAAFTWWKSLRLNTGIFSLQKTEVHRQIPDTGSGSANRQRGLLAQANDTDLWLGLREPINCSEISERVKDARYPKTYSTGCQKYLLSGDPEISTDYTLMVQEEESVRFVSVSE